MITSHWSGLSDVEQGEDACCLHSINAVNIVNPLRQIYPVSKQQVPPLGSGVCFCSRTMWTKLE